jgi:hypothetical protein
MGFLRQRNSALGRVTLFRRRHQLHVQKKRVHGKMVYRPVVFTEKIEEPLISAAKSMHSQFTSIYHRKMYYKSAINACFCAIIFHFTTICCHMLRKIDDKLTERETTMTTTRTRRLCFVITRDTSNELARWSITVRDFGPGRPSAAPCSYV